MASGSEDETLKVWNYVTGAFKYTLNVLNGDHRDAATSLASLGNNLMASGSRDTFNNVKLWKIFE
jgi:WD40 repeat protein